MGTLVVLQASSTALNTDNKLSRENMANGTNYDAPPVSPEGAMHHPVSRFVNNWGYGC